MRIQTHRLMRTLILLVAAAGLAVTPVEATKVRPVNLEEMTERAATIFSGRCIDVREVEDPGIGRTVTVAVFEVDRSIKGARGRRVTVKMLGGSDGKSSIVGMPRFHEGEQVILFLYGESPLGLSSPVGLGQGKFSIYEDKQGRHLAVNGMGNRNLLEGLSADAKFRLGESLESTSDGRGLDPTSLLDMAKTLQD
jgi:hypothetical protein